MSRISDILDKYEQDIVYDTYGNENYFYNDEDLEEIIAEVCSEYFDYLAFHGSAERETPKEKVFEEFNNSIKK